MTHKGSAKILLSYRNFNNSDTATLKCSPTLEGCQRTEGSENHKAILLYFDCFSGISGDMAVGALIDAGVKIEVIEAALAKIKIKGFELKARKVKRLSLSGTEFRVEIKKHRHFSSPEQINKLLQESKLDDRVKTLSLKIFSCLIKAEKAVHQAGNRHKIHLHEVGELDSIIDVVGFSAAACFLEIDKFFVSRVCLGTGMIDSAAGRLPLPCPAAVFLLKGMPVYFTGISSELVTPTGAAILRAVVSETQVPVMDVQRIGYGAGQRELSQQPNMLRIIIGQQRPIFAAPPVGQPASAAPVGQPASSGGYEKDTVIVLQANIDDMEPARYEYVMERLFKIGALDIYLTPVIMKKSRPGIVLTVLLDSSHFSEVTDVIFEETTTFGVRFFPAGRAILARKIISLDTRYGRVRLKTGYRDNKVIKTAPEYEDCLRLAREKKVPLQKIYDSIRKKTVF